MPAFAYKGLNARGKPVSGVREADSPRAARSLLKREGIFVTDLNAASAKVEQGEGLSREVDFKGLFDRVKANDVAMVTRQLGTLLRAGIPLTEALAALVEQVNSPRFRRALAQVRTRVNEGKAFADALAEHDAIFNELYISMVRAGETAGNLESVAVRLADLLDAQIRLKNRISSAMMYPIVMALVGIAITGILMVVVVPRITQIFADVGQSLPWYTQILITTSEITGSYWWLIALAMFGGWRLFSRWKESPKGRLRWHTILLSIWIVGPVVRMVAVGRFARTLGTMLSSGVPLLKAMEISRSVVGNQVLIDVLEKAQAAVREGEGISQPLARSGEFPPMVTRMIAVGERSGQLEHMLDTVASSNETDVELKLGKLATLMEPVTILVMGSVVGFIVFSILMPILQMNEMIG